MSRKEREQRTWLVRSSRCLHENVTVCNITLKKKKISREELILRVSCKCFSKKEWFFIFLGQGLKKTSTKTNATKTMMAVRTGLSITTREKVKKKKNATQWDRPPKQF